MCGVTTDGKVYTWGQNNNRSMGLDEDKQYRNPTLITKTIDAWGNNQNGALGDGGYTKEAEPKPISFLVKKKVIQISCGGFWNGCLTNSGDVYTWGK